ncbi:unnamed protein product, partial [Mesorhabditis belari]|uniref:Uncharacterized protein n=1 Tax=Mesorhabditis belari TaxID=2138241 RepID=A0AAF3F1T3_9BILA
MNTAQRMSNERRDRLKALSDRIVPRHVDGLIRCLRSTGTLNAISAETLLNKNSSNLADDLVRMVSTRGNAAFDAFFLALTKCCLFDLANELRPFVAEDVVESLENRFSAEIGAVQRASVMHFPLNERFLQSAKISDEVLPLDHPLDFCVDLIDGDAPLIPQWDTYQKAKDKIYPNFTKPKGLALIINNHRFSSMPHRTGTDVDMLNLQNLFSQLGYSVKIERDLTSLEITNAVANLAQSRSLLNTSSLILTILTHGEHNCVLGVDEMPVDINRLLGLLNAENCPSMAGKPKLIFVQACRGERRDRGTEEPDCASGEATSHNQADMFRLFSCVQQQGVQTRRKRIPSEADFLIAYATPPLHVSWRNTTRGSWFVQALCEIFSRDAKTDDISTMLTAVCDKVSSNETGDRYKQCTDTNNRLRKKFYFFPGLSRNTAV